MRDAARRGFMTYVVPEATGDISDAAHQGALFTMGHLFGFTVPLADAKEALGRRSRVTVSASLDHRQPLR